MALYRVKARWSGFTGAPGYSVFHFDIPTSPNPTDATTHATLVRNFFSQISGRLPSIVKVTVEAAVEVINESSGQLQDVVQIPSQAEVAGSSTGGFSAATGGCIVWTTGGVRNGRRVMGRTFIVPMTGAAYDTDGTLTSIALQAMRDGANLLVAPGTQFGVYARPTSTGAADGDFFIATGTRITDKTAVLRSRRD